MSDPCNDPAMSLLRTLRTQSGFDVNKFDTIVQAFYSGGSPQIPLKLAHDALAKFQEHPDSWTNVSDILTKSGELQAKIIALNILTRCIRYRWKLIPIEQKKGMKIFLENAIVNYSRKDDLGKEATLLTKLNTTLIEVLKQEWPQNWKTFISDLTALSQQKESVCCNSMKIFQLLSEEIMGTEKNTAMGEMTQEKRLHLKKSLQSEFEDLFKLSMLVLERCQDKKLLEQTLITFSRFVQWMPLGYIFETPLLKHLTLKFYPSQFQSGALACLTEIVSIPLGQPGNGLQCAPEKVKEFRKTIAEMFLKIHEYTVKIIPPDQDLQKQVNQHGNSVVVYLRSYANFMNGLVQQNVSLLDQSAHTGEPDRVAKALLESLCIMVGVTMVDDQELFKISLDMWKFLLKDLKRTHRPPSALNSGFPFGAMTQQNCRFEFYSRMLSQLRMVFVEKMVRPKEVLVTTDENGEVHKVELKDTVNLMIYNSMKECLHTLTILDPHDTRNQLMKNLDKFMDINTWDNNRSAQHSKTGWSARLNKLCWAIGSISGAMSENLEKNFVVHVIKILLSLCEIKKGKQNKAVIAADIMYVVRKYPRFLRNHWKFLKTVVNKLIEFMHENFPGVQDMAVETLLEIIQNCKKRFVKPQDGEEPFLNEIIKGLPDTLKDLQDAQVYLLYESLGIACRAENNPHTRSQLIFALMAIPNERWVKIQDMANADPTNLTNPVCVKQLRGLLSINTSVARSTQDGYFVQFSRLFELAMGAYKVYSGVVQQAIKEGGVAARGNHNVRLCIAAMNDVLKWLREFLKHVSFNDLQTMKDTFIPAMLERCLVDYSSSHNCIKNPHVLTLCAELVDRLSQNRAILASSPEANIVNQIYKHTFNCTLNMIRTNMEDHTDHRLKFFQLIRVTNKRCFQVIFAQNTDDVNTVIQSVVWAFQHLEKNVSETGLEILEEMLVNMENSDISNEFFKMYLMVFVEKIFLVLTDQLHASGFDIQCRILQKIFKIVDSGTITVPLAPQSSGRISNQQHLSQAIVQLLHKGFPHLGQQVLENFVRGLFQLCNQPKLFTPHIRDFLVTIKEFQVAAGHNPQRREE